MSEPLLTIKNISKEFSGVRVLNNINIDINRGEIYGILGENGAGKSTLLKIICGIYTPSAGELFLAGRKVSVGTPMEAKALGISMIPQEFNLIETLTVFENIFLGSEVRKGFLLDKPYMREQTSNLMQELQTDLSPNALISSLSVAQKQMVEIAKALVHDSHILIMDEPTTVLTIHEVEILFDLMAKLKEKGVTILFISHKLKEVKRVCDRILILRDGDQIGVEEVQNVDEHDMARKMVGRELNQTFPEKSFPQEEVVLQVRNLNITNLLTDISFELKKGEILGFSGLIGAGRTELAESLMGLRPKNSGEITINGEKVDIQSPLDALKHKLGYLSEDRKGKGLLLNFRIPENITLISLKKYTRWFIRKEQEAESTRNYIKQFNIKASSLKSELEFLSGGNQQKVYFSKWMDTDPDILILDEPTRGIDVNAKRDMYHFIHSLVEAGVSCIIISSELEEIIGLCTRVIVMREGRITSEVSGEHINEEEIMYYAAGLN
ncbi:sugar ABC transporter ATP-binding protein [bacterium]|nr:sugar ABC transporter ATP-binding protein [bacterium]